MLQNAAKENHDRYLFEMATGTGKTLISAAVIKLFLKTGNAKQVLFLVDRLELEEQARRVIHVPLFVAGRHGIIPAHQVVLPIERQHLRIQVAAAFGGASGHVVIMAHLQSILPPLPGRQA